MVGEFRNEDKIVNSLFLQFSFLPYRAFSFHFVFSTKEKIKNHSLFSLPIICQAIIGRWKN